MRTLVVPLNVDHESNIYVRIKFLGLDLGIPYWRPPRTSVTARVIIMKTVRMLLGWKSVWFVEGH